MRSTVMLGAALAGLFLLTACAAGPAQTPIPTLDPRALTVTAVPTSTPQPTYTPHPTAERIPTRTPLPTFPPRFTGRVGGTQTPTDTAPARPTATEGPSPTPLPPQGLQDVGGPAPDLVPILTIIDTGATCGKQGTHALVQLGVTNRGNWSAQNFTVEWSLGWEDPFKGEVRREFIGFQEWGLQWSRYFVNEYVWVPCEATTTYRAYVWVDIGNDVAELYEDNNFAEISYTITQP